MKIRSDTRYSDYNLQLQLIEAKSSTLYLNEAFSNMKFHTMRQYKQAQDIKVATERVVQDMTYVLTSPSTQLTGNTFIRYHLDTIQKNAQIIQPELKSSGDDTDYGRGKSGTQLQIGLAYLDRAGKNFVYKNTPVKNYRIDKYSQILQREASIAQKFIVKGEKNILDNIDTYTVVDRAINIAVPRLLIFASTMYRKQSPIICGAINAVGDIYKQIQDELGKLSQGLTEWGDIQSNPFGQILNAMTGIQGLVTASYSIIGNIAGAIISDVGKGVIDAIFSGDDSDDSVKSSLYNTIIAVFMTLGKLLSGIMNLVLQSVQLSFTAFLNIITAMFNLVKSMIKSSPVFEQILNYLNLALSLLFLPFFTTVGTPVLEQIMSLYSWIITEPKKLMDDFIASIWGEGEINQFIDYILDNLTYFITSLQDGNFYELVSELVKQVKDFMDSFKETILDNQDDIINFLKDGLILFNKLIENGLFSKFMEICSSGMDFIKNNIHSILNIIQAMFEIIKSGFEVFGKQIPNFYILMNLIFVGLGAVAGQLTGFRVGELATLLTGGLGQITIPELALAGQAIGAGVGEVQWNIIETTCLRKDWITYYKTYETPDQSGIQKFAHGGKIYKRDGGMFGIIAEAGEGEWAIPKSKMKLFRGNNNIVIRINGRTYNKNGIDSAIKELEPVIIYPFDDS